MNDIVQVDNPFGSNEVAPRGGYSTGNTDQSRAIAEVQAMLVVARQNPRQIRVAMDRILNECQMPKLAERAIFSYVKGGSDIEGPSIHLARAIARNWGNISFGIRELERADGVSIAQSFAWDQETNTREERVFFVRHQIGLRGGRTKVLTDEREIYELIANMGARRERACILGLIPSDVVEAAVDQSNATLRAKADTSPEAIQKMVMAFADQFGVTKPQLEARCQRRIDTIQPAQMVSLKKIYASLRDDMSKPDDWFDPIDDQQGGAVEGDKPKGNAALKEALKGKAPPKKDEKLAGVVPAAEDDKQTVGDAIGDSIPTFDGPNDGTLAGDNPSAAEGPADEQRGEPDPDADYHSEIKPEGATRNQSWYNPADGKLRFAHETPNHGIKWYLKPQEDEQQDDAPLAPSGDQPSEARILADSIRDAADLDELADIQSRFDQAKPRIDVDDITALRTALAERRNELS